MYNFSDVLWASTGVPVLRSCSWYNKFNKVFLIFRARVSHWQLCTLENIIPRSQYKIPFDENWCCNFLHGIVFTISLWRKRLFYNKMKILHSLFEFSAWFLFSTHIGTTNDVGIQVKLLATLEKAFFVKDVNEATVPRWDYRAPLNEFSTVGIMSGHLFWFVLDSEKMPWSIMWTLYTNTRPLYYTTKCWEVQNDESFPVLCKRDAA